MPETNLTLSDLLELPGKTFSQQVLTAGVSDEELISLKEQISGALKGMQWGHLEETVCGKLSEQLNKDPMELIASAWEKYHVLAEAAEQSKSGETVFVPLEQHSISSELHPYVEIQVGPQVVKKIEFQVSLTLQLKGLVLKIEAEKIKAIEAGLCEGRGEIRVKDVTIWKHDIKPINLVGKINLGAGISIH